jgi:hypothetical protein
MTRITHEQARHYLHAGRDQLNTAERAELDGHLAGCPECRSYAAELASFWPMLTHALRAHWGAPRPAPGLERRVQAQVGKRLVLRRFQRRAGPWVTAGVGIATVVLLVFLLFATGPFAERSQSASAPEATASITPSTENQVNRASPTPLPGLAVFGDQITLLDSSLADYPSVPGGTLSLTLHWQTSTPIETPYNIFVHLLDATGNLVAQSDVRPEGDVHSTIRWRPGETIEDRHLLELPGDLAAGPYQLVVGLYDLRTGDRLFASDGQVSVRLATIEVRAIAQRVDEDFGDFATLLGFDLSSERASPGDTVDVTLYWRARAQTDVSYAVSVQVFGDDKQIVAQVDSVPGGGAHPTTDWQPDEVIADPITIRLPADLPEGQYDIVLLMFDATGGTQVFTGTGNGAVVLATLNVQEPTSTPVPTPNQVGYPPDTRTGIPVVDAVIEAILIDDRDRLQSLIHYATVGCTHVLGLGGPPKCKAEEAEGTLVEGLPLLGHEGMAIRREDLDIEILSGKYVLYAVYRDPVEAYIGEDWWLPARYGIVFVRETSSAMTLLVDDSGIVREILTETPALAMQWVSGDFILPPATSTVEPTP